MTNPLLNLQKKHVEQAVNTNFRKNYLRRLEIDGQPELFDIFVKDISYGKGTIESETIDIANGQVNKPHKRTAGSVTVVFLDDEYGTISDFISSLQNRIFNSDGTQNLPVDYLFSLRIYRVTESAEEYLEKEWQVYVEENNDYSGDNESTTENGTFSVTFKKYKSFGG